MRHKFSKTIVIALGGSIIYPHTKSDNSGKHFGVGVNSGSINISFLKKFRKFILKRLASKSYRRSGLQKGSPASPAGRRFIIVVGGGHIARVYQEAAHKVSKITDEDKDWLGIHSTRANAHLLRTIFKDVADPVIIDSRDKMKALKYPVIIASGWRPGWSTDYISIAIAEHFGIKEVVIAGKPSHVYDRDPNKHGDAKPLQEISWHKYRNLIPKKWIPGLHSPVDPVGARLAEKKGIAAIIINGKDLKNFENMLSGKEFKGSIIK